MNPFKNHDWKHILAYVACVAVLGACQIPDVHPYQATILMIVAPLFLYAGIVLPQAGYGSDDAKKILAAAKKVGPVAVLFLLVGAAISVADHRIDPATCTTVEVVEEVVHAAGGPVLALEGCTHEQTVQVESILPNAAVCIGNVIEDVNGVIDIPGTLQSCGVTIQQLVAYLEAYFSGGDAGADAAVALSASPMKVQRASKLLDAARAYQKAHP